MPTSSRCNLTITPLALAMLLVFPMEAWSAAGKTLYVTGEVNVVHPGQAAARLSKGTEINAGDLISTGANGFTQIVMDDGGRLTLRANSQLKITQFNYSGKKDGSERSLMSLLTGSMRAVTGWIGHSNRDNYKVNTPTATIGIRGSDGNFGYSPEIGSSVQTLEGGHTITNIDPNGITHTLVLKPGDVGLLPPNSTTPLRVNNFPFATTQPPNVKTEINESSAPETPAESENIARETPTPTETDNAAEADTAPTTETALNDTVATEASPTTESPPSINDTSGGIIGLDTDGTPVVEIPDAPVPVVIPTGLSPKMMSVVTGTSFNPQSTGLYGQWRTDSNVGDASKVLLDGSGNLFKYYFDHDNDETGYTYIQNGTVNPQLSSGGATIGSWTGTATANTELMQQRIRDNNVSLGWASAQAGYYQYDPQNPTPLPLSGSTIYNGVSLGGHSFDQQNAVTLTSATLSADFTNQNVGISIDLMAGTTQWTANTATPVSLMSLGGQVYQNSFHADTYNSSLAVNNNLGLNTPIYGRVDGSFTGGNFTGALLQYNFSQSNPNSNGKGEEGVSGIIGYTPGGPVAAPTIINGPAQVDTIVISEASQIGPEGLLATNITSTSWTYSQSDRQTFDLSHIGGTNTSNTVWTNGINSGTWDSGQIQTVEHDYLDTNGSFAWGTLERPQAWYISSLLTGTATYTLSAATTPQATDGSTWSINTVNTGLTVDFTNQKVNAQIGFMTGSDSIVASTTNAPLQNPDGGFSASTNSNNGDDGLLTFTRNSITLTNQEASGRIAGQLGGTGLADAILGYGFNITPACVTNCVPGNTAVSGMLAFTGPQQSENVPFTIVDVAADFVNAKSTSTLGFNSTSQLTTDGQGISGFNLFPDSGSGGARIERSTASVLESGSDTATGLSWGRWGNGANVLDQGTVVGQANNVHFIASSETGPALLPLSGTFSYNKVGYTTPTNQSGITGTLDAATLTADFSARQVNVGVTATVAGTTLTGTANNLPLFDNAFHADSSGGGTGPLNVGCSGTCSTQTNGVITGHFTGNGAVGAGLSYSLGSGTTINGVVAFQRVDP